MTASEYAETCLFINTLLINWLCLTYIILSLLIHKQRGCLNLNFQRQVTILMCVTPLCLFNNNVRHPVVFVQ